MLYKKVFRERIADINTDTVKKEEGSCCSIIF